MSGVAAPTNHAHRLLFKPADRHTVLDAIRKKWVTLEAFDKFVQEDLAKVMADSKRRYSQQLVTVALKAVSSLLGD